MQMPGNNGGSNFGSAAVDPEHGTVFVVSKDWPSLLKLSLPANAVPQYDGSMPYTSGLGFMVTTQGMNAIAPPWTSMTAFDLNAGTIKWKIPVGEIPELAAKGITDTGSQFPKVGPVVTATGLIFIGTRDKKIRAFDADTGKVLWTFETEAGVEGMPAIYEINGKEYLGVLRRRKSLHPHPCAVLQRHAGAGESRRRRWRRCRGRRGAGGRTRRGPGRSGR